RSVWARGYQHLPRRWVASCWRTNRTASSALGCAKIGSTRLPRTPCIRSARSKPQSSGCAAKATRSFPRNWSWDCARLPFRFVPPQDWPCAVSTLACVIATTCMLWRGRKCCLLCIALVRRLNTRWHAMVGSRWFPEAHMADVFIAAATRTPFGRYGRRLAAVRCDDLAAAPLTSLIANYPAVDWGAVDDVVLGCANQAGEDSRNVARMAALLAGLPESVPAVTVNRLCASGLEAVGLAARAIAGGDAELVIAGGVESVSRVMLVMAMSEIAIGRVRQLEFMFLRMR